MADPRQINWGARGGPVAPVNPFVQMLMQRGAPPMLAPPVVPPRPMGGMQRQPFQPVIQPTPRQRVSAPADPNVLRARQGPLPSSMPSMSPYGQAAISQLGSAFANPMGPLQTAFDWANAPQGRNEPRISALLRNGGTPIKNGSIPFSDSLVARAGRDIGMFAQEMMRTPADQEQISRQVFASMLQAENRQRPDGSWPVSPKGAIGPAQVMPGTAPEAAKLAGLPWDPERYKNDAEYNRAIGFAYFKEKLRQNNGDYAKAVAAYNAGQGNVQKAMARGQAAGQPWEAFVPNETQGYLSKVLGRLGPLAESFGAPAPAFNASPYVNAANAQAQAANLLTQPYSATFTETPLPDRPTPEAFQAPDFSEGDAAFAATAPKNPFDDPKEKRKVQWSGFAKGIGQALASMSGNEGIGTMLMKIGGMALQGRVSGDEKIAAKEEEFEQNMAAYNRALAAREDGQAATLANVMNQNIQQRNQQADLIWQDNVKKIQSKNPIVSGDKMITYDKDPEDPNKWKMTVTPLGNAIQAEALINRANIGIQMGQAMQSAGQFAYTAQQTAARTAIGMTTQMALSQGGSEGANASAEGYLLGAAQRARAAVQAGTWRDMFGGDQTLVAGLESIAQRQAYARMGIPLREDGTPVNPQLDSSQTSQYAELYEDSMTSTIFEAVAKAGTINKLFDSPTANRALITQRSGNARSTQRTDARGRTTSSMSWDME